MTDADAARERAINAHCKLLAMARTRAEQYKHWQGMWKLIYQRSPEQVARMERERGLR